MRVAEHRPAVTSSRPDSRRALRGGSRAVRGVVPTSSEVYYLLRSEERTGTGRAVCSAPRTGRRHRARESRRAGSPTSNRAPPATERHHRRARRAPSASQVCPDSGGVHPCGRTRRCVGTAGRTGSAIVRDAAACRLVDRRAAAREAGEQALTGFLHAVVQRRGQAAGDDQDHGHDEHQRGCRLEADRGVLPDHGEQRLEDREVDQVEAVGDLPAVDEGGTSEPSATAPGRSA